MSETLPMNEHLAYFNGRYLPLSQAAVPVYDTGFLLGTTVAEQLRTFGGRLFRLREHLDRLAKSLSIVGVEPRQSIAELQAIAEELASRNHALLEADDDLGLTIFVTPGPTTAAAAQEDGPLVCMHTRALPFGQWADKYTTGEKLVTTSIQQVSTHCWPAELKCRSRMHYYLADRQAQAIQRGARALMLDADGFATEATSANVLYYFRSQGLIVPPRHKLLPGISVAVLGELAASLGLGITERDITPAEVASADEILLTSTSPCVLPVVEFNGRPVGRGTAADAPIFRSLLAAWSKLVGLDISAQARRFAKR